MTSSVCANCFACWNSPSVASNALQSLAALHVVVRRDAAGAHLYRLANDGYLMSHLRGMMSDTSIVGRDFGCTLLGMLDGFDVQAAILYGSVARGEDKPESDVDVLLIAEGTDDEKSAVIIAQVEERISRHVGRPVQIVMTEWPTASERRRTFWREVV